MKTKKQFDNMLQKLNACQEAQDWFNSFDGTLEQAWLQCERGDWLLWLLDKLDADRKKIVLSACGCARLVLKYNDDKRVIGAIETAEAWTRNEVTLEELGRAAEAAAWAARAAEAAAWAAEAATLKQCADIVRQQFTFEEVIGLINEN